MGNDEFFDNLWNDYLSVTPQAGRIHQLFINDGNTIVNDHVAFRTFNISPINLTELDHQLARLGYRPYESYRFKEKKLNAWSYLAGEEGQPRIFLSELRVEELSLKAQAIINRCCKQIDPALCQSPSVFSAGRLWETPTWDDYQSLLAESEYAAWVLAMGLRPNHFTISVNHLKEPYIGYVLSKLGEADIPLNQSGGVIKGGRKDLLEQCSTLADKMVFEFADGERHTIKTCYYEFAKRYQEADGRLFEGFVSASADKIFESTDRSTNEEVSC